MRESRFGNYFVATYPPFSCWDRAGARSYRAELDRPPRETTPLGLYVHVPFCEERCSFCYYLSHDDERDRVDAYLDALDREAGIVADLPAIRGRPISFAYVGGGTPSFLSTRRVERLLDDLHRHFDLTPAREITFECAPRTVTAAKLGALRERGVTRLSVGVQQMDDEVLERNGRIHRVADVERAWERVREAGFPVVNLDLIAGLVGESESSFFGSVDRLIGMGPESITIYPLEIPLNTPLAADLRAGRIEEPPGWERKRARLAVAFERLEKAGYTLRSAYTAVKDPDAHRFVYQDEQYGGADLLGLGVSSFSSIGAVQHQNPADLTAYLSAMQGADLPLWRGYRLSPDERAVREMVLQWKLGRVDRESFRRRHGVDPARRFAGPLRELDAAGLARVSPSAIELTRRGLLRADGCVSCFYQPAHQGIRYS